MSKIIVDDREPENIKKMANKLNEQNLNEKIAKWAGFNYEVIVSGENRWWRWKSPDGQYSIGLPNFTESLDACFKWVIMPLWIKLNKDGKAYKMQRLWVALEDSLLTTHEYHGRPALALCLAVEKLIDST